MHLMKEDTLRDNYVDSTPIVEFMNMQDGVYQSAYDCNSATCLYI